MKANNYNFLLMIVSLFLMSCGKNKEKPTLDQTHKQASEDQIKVDCKEGIYRLHENMYNQIFEYRKNETKDNCRILKKAAQDYMEAVEDCDFKNTDNAKIQQEIQPLLDLEC